jgi:RimJ/RimL family protein N-acetyltransferase
MRERRTKPRAEVMLSRTEDMELVRQIMIHPSIYPWIVDDGGEPAANFAPPVHPAVHYVEVRAMDVDDVWYTVGVYMLVPQSSRCFEIHTCILPSGYGRPAAEASQLILRYLFDGARPLADKLISRVPADNPRALAYSLRAGLKPEGVNRASFLRNGKLLDQTWVGITRTEWKEAQCLPQSL